MNTLPSLNEKSGNPRKRLIISIFLILGIFFILFSRLFFLQVVKGEKYRMLSEGNRIRLKRLKAPRGLILDRNHRVLVQNRPSFAASILSEDVQDLEKTLNTLSSLLNKPVEQMRKTIKKTKAHPFEPFTLISDLSFKEIAILEEHRNQLLGITVEVEAVRYYPYQEFAAHLLGYMGEINQYQLRKKEYQSVRIGDKIGQSGLEKVANSYLIGKDGGKHVEIDAEGRELSTLGYLAPEPGKNIILTIDLVLQKKAEEILGSRCGAIIAMNPQNGEILAMVSHPAFNPNMFAKGITKKEWLDLVKNPKDLLQNRVIMASYPPGSIFKLVVAAAGLSSGIIDERSTFYCSGFINFGDWVFYCWKGEGHGQLSIHDAIVHSCNSFFYQLSLRLGIDIIANYARSFGFGRQTEIMLFGENSGLIPDSLWKKKAIGSSWYPGETITASIGQGYILVTPIQLACFISSFANGGLLFEPRIIDSIETSDGTAVKKFPPIIKTKILISPKDIKIIRKALKGVVNENGTGWRAYSPDIVIAGKTGTAQVIKLREQEEEESSGAEENLPEHMRDHAWFVAFAPFEDPEVAVVVFIEHGGHGGYSSAPLAKELILAYFQGDKSL